MARLTVLLRQRWRIFAACSAVEQTLAQEAKCSHCCECKARIAQIKDQRKHRTQKGFRTQHQLQSANETTQQGHSAPFESFSDEDAEEDIEEIEGHQQASKPAEFAEPLVGLVALGMQHHEQDVIVASGYDP